MKSMKKCVVTKEKISKSIKLDKRRSNKRRSSAGMFYTSSAGAVTSLILITLLSILTTLSYNINSVHATASTINISVVDSVSLNILPNGTTGTFATSDTSTNNISVRTTNGTGYTLGIKASTEGSNALNGANSTSIPSHTVSAGISEATYSTDSTYNNTWGYRPSKLNSAANSNYLPGPTSASSPIELDKTTSANPSTANNYNLAIGVRVDGNTAAGAYSNTFILTVVANPSIYSITYNKNTTDTVTNMPANTSSQTYDETVNISNTVPARDGFNFKGWCTTQTADGGTCSGTTYNPDGDGTNLAWTLDQTASSSSLSIYAMWEVAGINLYDAVAGMVKKTNGNPRTQTLADMQAVITKPTSNDPATDTSNSGVYKYDASLFGTASDNNSACTRSDGCPIYYYRGILDSDLTDASTTTAGYVGSSGDGAYYPNYVVLSSASNKGSLTTSNTCWRIVRTTGSGGIKMIYNGKWTGSTCANAGSSANAVSSVYFNRRSSSSTNKYDTIGRIIYVGYNYSSTSSHQTGTSTVSNSTLFVNNKASNLRTQLESWYASNMTSYTSKLETNAGWCNDRTTYNDSYKSQSSTVPYKTSSATVYFGAYKRNRRSGASEKLSLTCTNAADRLTTSNGMTYPAAPLTADEAALAGSGYTSTYGSTSTYSSNYHNNSYLRSGDNFWLLSPYIRSSSGEVYEFRLISISNLDYYHVSYTFGVRPSISLNPGTTAVSGTGTAADPWIVNPDPNPYCTDASTCMQNTTNPPACGTTMVDGRDGATYTTATIAGTCWMTRNLRFTGAELKVGETNVTSDKTISPYGALTSGNSYTEPRKQYNNNTGYGAYYNYCAVSAQTVCNNTTQADATQDICPAGWKLPTEAQLNALPEKESHFTAASGLSGIYNGGSLISAGAYGSWWASTAGDSASLQYFVEYDSDLGFWGVNFREKYSGYSVRCVRAS